MVDVVTLIENLNEPGKSFFIISDIPPGFIEGIGASCKCLIHFSPMSHFYTP